MLDGELSRVATLLAKHFVWALMIFDFAEGNFGVVALWINLQIVHHLEKFSNVCSACSWPRFYG